MGFAITMFIITAVVLVLGYLIYKGTIQLGNRKVASQRTYQKTMGILTLILAAAPFVVGLIKAGVLPRGVLIVAEVVVIGVVLAVVSVQKEYNE